MTDGLALQHLWTLIKGKKNLFHGTYTGLRVVPFDFPLDEFIRRYNQKIEENWSLGDDDNPVGEVVADIGKAVELLSKVDIRFHHLSCAASSRGGKNSALCVHYMTSLDAYSLSSIAVPGVDYIPSPKTAAMLKRFYEKGGTDRLAMHPFHRLKS